MDLRTAAPSGTRTGLGATFAALVAFLTTILMVMSAGSASAATVVPLGTAAGYSVLAGSAVTNTGATTLQGDLGVGPGASVTGFPPGTVGGARHIADAPALAAQSDLTTAYDAAGQGPATAVAAELGGTTLVPGIYGSAELGLTGTLTLDGQGATDGVFIIRSDSTLTTASDSSVSLVNGADPCNVFWRVGSSATLGSGTRFVGSILASTSITLNTQATLEGRALTRTGAVNLDTSVITTPDCSVSALTSTTTTDPATTTTDPATTTTDPATTTTAPPTTTDPSPTTVPPTTTTDPPVVTDLTTTTAPTTTDVVPPPVGGSTGEAVVIPAGHPETGTGGTAPGADGVMVALGGIALAGSVVTAGLARRGRRRSARRTALMDPSRSG